MIISNNVVGKIPFPKGTIVRVNSAWVRTRKELYAILKSNKGNDVFLDFPSGRTKPPKPTLGLDVLISTAKMHHNVKYFAVSNAENLKILAEIRKKLPIRIEFVPKIETLTGVSVIEDIIKVCKTRTVMLDKEDLYLDALSDCYEENGVETYEKAVKTSRDTCKALNVKLYELQGVIFG